MAQVIVNPGSSIQNAINNAQDGDEILIKTGTYNEIINIPYRNNLKIHAYSVNDKVIVNGNKSTVGEWRGIFFIDHSNGIEISRLTIVNSNYFGILCYRSSGCQLKYNYIENTQNSGIMVEYSTNSIVDNNTVSHACNSVDFCHECVSIVSSSQITVSNNHITDSGSPTTGGEGIDIKRGVRDIKVINNVVHDVQHVGIYVDAFDEFASNIEVAGNIVHTVVDGAGIAVSGERTGLTEYIDIHNNVVNGATVAGILCPGYKDPTFPIGVSKDVNISYNTINNSLRGIWIGQWDTKLTNYNVSRNLLSNNVQGNIIWQHRNQHTNIVVDNNYFDILTSDAVDTYFGTNYVVGGDPLYVNQNNNDFHLLPNSPALEYGAYAISKEEANMLVIAGMSIVIMGAAYAIYQTATQSTKKSSTYT